MEPVRVATVGIGRWSNVLADAIPGGTNLSLVACTTRSAEKRAAFAEKYRCRQAESYDAILKDPEVEAVLLTTPDSLHAKHIIAAAQAGKHVFVDKPFTLTVAAGEEATEACRRAGVVLAVGHQRRRQPANRGLKTLIQDGALGQLIQIEGNISSSTGFEMTPTVWRAHPEASPAGPMTWLGIHHVDTFQYLLGPISCVVALSRRQVLKGMEIDDSTAILLEFESGILGYLGTSSVVANRTAILTLHGSEAHAFSEAEGSRLYLWKKGEPDRSPLPLKPVDTIVEELAEFARCVREGSRPEVGGEEGTANVAVLEAVVESISTGQPVTVKKGDMESPR
ncbi:MAG TPA: Gfo/Idh/MocA family oxidoreductase [Candidatus Binatia bacterium]|jgi:predicted dehydrogenase